MNKDKSIEIIEFSFFKYFQNKWFIIFNLLSLFSIVLGLNWSNFSEVLSFINPEKTFEIAILDDNNIIYDSFNLAMQNDEKYKVSQIEENNYTSDNIPKDFIIIEVYEDEVEPFTLKIITKEGLDNDVGTQLYNVIRDIRNQKIETENNISPELLQLIQSDVKVERIMLSVDAENSMLKNIINYFAAALTYLLSVIIFTRISSEVSQEKSSKSSEYILTSVNEKDYLFAKVFSNILILIIQILLMIAYYVISASLFSLLKTTSTDISLVDSLTISGINADMVWYVLSLVFYNIITLILLSIVQATLAAKTSSPLEAGNTTSILAFVMMLLYIFTISVINPYTVITPILYGLSVIPVFSGFLIPAMIMIGQANIFQIIVSIALMLFLIPKAFNYCATIFKNGLLDYTKKSKKVSIFNLPEDTSLKTLLNKRTFMKLGNVVGISIIIYIGSQVIFSLMINLILGTFDTNVLSETNKFLIFQCTSQATSLALAYLFVKNNTNNSKKELDYKLSLSKPRIIFITLAFIIILQSILTLIYPIIGLEYKNDVFGQLNISYTSSFATKLLLIIALALTPAIFEELFFRKALINLFKKHGKVFAVIFSSIIFGFIHMNLSQGLFAFIVGLILGTIYVCTKDIKLTMLIHFLNNGFEALTLIIPPENISQSYSLLMNFCLIVVLLVGIGYFVTYLLNTENRQKLIRIAFRRTKKGIFGAKYIYLFFDYIFDISIVLLLLSGFLTEKIYRM